MPATRSAAPVAGTASSLIRCPLVSSDYPCAAPRVPMLVTRRGRITDESISPYAVAMAVTNVLKPASMPLAAMRAALKLAPMVASGASITSVFSVKRSRSATASGLSPAGDARSVASTTTASVEDGNDRHPHERRHDPGNLQRKLEGVVDHAFAERRRARRVGLGRGDLRTVRREEQDAHDRCPHGDHVARGYPERQPEWDHGSGRGRLA